MRSLKNVLLAPNEKISLDNLSWPQLVSYKLDGVRMVVMDGEFFSRSMKIQPNKMLRSQFAPLADAQGYVFDGELYSHDPSIPFQELMSRVRSAEGDISPIKYYVFDCLRRDEWDTTPSVGFAARVFRYRAIFEQAIDCAGVVPVEQFRCASPEEAQAIFETAIAAGYEGIMLRNPGGGYKHGRATVRENLMYKYKPWITVDALVVGWYRKKVMKPEVREGVRTRDVLGYLRPSGHQEDFEEIDELGGVEVELESGVRTNVTFVKGFPRPSIREIPSWLGTYVEIESLAVGVKDKPRFGRIVRQRPDLSE
jgi:hypothetical protein